MVSSVAVFLVGLTAVVWYQAQGLEQRVLAAIQPHLKTDVQIGSVDLTVLRSWPDVEVTLRDVVVEDAVELGQPFLQLEQVGVVFAWMPLLFGRFEVDQVQLRQGAIRVQRYADGRESWRFWEVDDVGGGEAVDWSVRSLVLEDVTVEGEWTADGASQPVAWRALCLMANLQGDVDAAGVWNVVGPLDLEGADLEAGGEQWMKNLGLSARLDIVLKGTEVSVQINSGRAVGPDGGVDFEGGIYSRSGFELALSFAGVESKAAMGVLPMMLQDRLGEDVPNVSGEVDLDVVVGRPAAGLPWAGPSNPEWSGSWGVRVVPQDLSVNWQGAQANVSGGQAVVYSMGNGWRAEGAALKGRMAGGETQVSGQWASTSVGDEIDLELRQIARLGALLEVVEPWWGVPAGWSVGPDGVIQSAVEVGFRRPSHGTWQWRSGEVDVSLSDVMCTMPGSLPVDERRWNADAAHFQATPETWSAKVDAVSGPGVQGGDLRLNQERKDVPMELDLKVERVDVVVLLNAFNSTASQGHFAGGAWPAMNWKLSLEEWTWDALQALRTEASGTYDWQAAVGRVKQAESAMFGGNAVVEGRWDARAVHLDGGLLGVSLSALLEGTEGLGQNTLLPSHVAGRLWADGTLDYHFNKAPALTWETALEVRIEEGELRDFELLQRIPETLKAEAKYRLLADTDDLSRRLKRVRFEPVVARVALERGVFTLEETDVMSDAMDIGIGGWQRLDGGMDYTLDFALRDLKSDQEEFGTTADDGLGHRFFLAIGGTLEAPEFGYDRDAHKAHRQTERRGALDRLKGVFGANEEGAAPVDSVRGAPELVVGMDTVRDADSPKPKAALDFDDDDDDF